MKVYGLTAKGCNALDNLRNILHGKVYETHALAEQAIPAFRQACTTNTGRGALSDLRTLADDDFLSIRVIEFTLVRCPNDS